MSARRRQAKGGIRADRERALLTVAYDTMARRSELVALYLEDFTFLPDWTGRALIRRSKTDQAGEGNTAYLGRHTVWLLQVWLHAANIREGACFGGRWGGGGSESDWRSIQSRKYSSGQRAS